MKTRQIREISIVLILTLLISVLVLPVTAATASSAYIWVTSATLTQGSTAGTIRVNYSITGMGRMDSIGVSKIEVYKSNGVKYRTIYGSVSNGLILNNRASATGSYDISCVAGTSYYCKVTLIAAKDGGYDTVTIQTSTVVAPTSP